MERFAPIQIVKKQLELKKIAINGKINPESSQKIKAIEEMLNNDRCFFKIDRTLAMKILLFLGFEESTAEDLYKQLTDYNLFKGNFEFIDLADAQQEPQKKVN